MKKYAYQCLLGFFLSGFTFAWPQEKPRLPASVITVAAASDLKFALTEIAASYEKNSGQKINLLFGSSGTLTTQLLQNAPFDIFMSADEHLVFKLAVAGKTQDRGRLYAIGRIGLFVPNSSALKADGTFKDLAAALQDGRLKQLAIANPEHAPYGQRARQALEHANLWMAVQAKLVLGENVSQAAQFAISGSAQAGIIALSLVLSPTVADKGQFELIPESWHQPLNQRMVLLKAAPSSARQFYDYMASAYARDILARYGFSLPK
ncbi:MAG: molybdate ABC transporter substrate-binding protein [Limnohabitans sp.]|nr:molybdate ABC transporter substrate-binding protein [Limnohabitans sp.]